MSFATFSPRKTLTLQNKNGHVNKVPSNFQDYSLSNPTQKRNRIKVDVESASVTTTLQGNTAQFIEAIFSQKNPLIKRRNKILNNPITLFIFPSLKKELKKIDAELDNLDLQLYLLEKEKNIQQTELDEIMQKAEARLEKYSKYLHSK